MGPEPGPVRRLRRPLALRRQAPRGGRPVRQGHHRPQVQRGPGGRHRGGADRQPLGPLRADAVPQQQPRLRGHPGLLRQVPAVRGRHPRPRLPHPAQHQEEGRDPVPGAAAALRHVHAVRHAVDLLHRQHVGDVRQRHRGRGLRQAGNVPQLRRRDHHDVRRRGPAARVRHLGQPVPAVRPGPARPQLPLPPGHQVPGVLRHPALPQHPGHRPLVRDQLPAVPAQLPALGVPVPRHLRGHRGPGRQGGRRRVLPGSVYSVPVDEPMPAAPLPVPLTTPRLPGPASPYDVLSPFSYQRVFWPGSRRAWWAAASFSL